MKTKISKGIIAAAACIMAFSVTACGAGAEKPTYKLDESEMPTVNVNTDIDVQHLQDAAENIKNLDLGNGTGTDASGRTNAEAASDATKESAAETKEAKNEAASEPSSETAGKTAGTPAGEAAAEPAGEKTVYSFTDVIRTSDGLYLKANGGMNGSTVLFGDKDLDGFLDYVDSTVLEEGRTINREMFYDLLAYMLVDDKLSANEQSRIKHVMMALAVSNNFHSVDVKIKNCTIKADNAANYYYNLTAYGAEDTWLVNYQDRQSYMRDGATEYVTDMFKDEYLAVWLMAIEDYYGVEL